MFFRKRKKDRNESDEEVQVDAFINLPTKTTITGDLFLKKGKSKET